MSFDTLLVFVVACFALACTPGPDMLLCLSRSLTQGRLAGFVTLAGINAGCAVHALAAGLGLSSLLVAAPVLFDVVRYLGVAYLLYLAVNMLRRTAAEDLHAPILTAKSMKLLFQQGFLTNLFNPKVALFFLAFFPQFMRPSDGPILRQAIVLFFVLMMVGFIVNGMIILFAGGLSRWAKGHARFANYGRWFLASVFGGLAVRLALQDR